MLNLSLNIIGGTKGGKTLYVKSVKESKITWYNLGLEQLKERIANSLKEYTVNSVGHKLSNMLYRESYIAAHQMHTIRIIADAMMDAIGDHEIFIKSFIMCVVEENGFIKKQTIIDFGFELIKD